jgi:hypothetical protein
MIAAGNWRADQVAYFMSESVDGQVGSVPLIAVSYPPPYPDATRSNLVCGVGHVSTSFACTGCAVAAGNLATYTLFQSSYWLTGACASRNTSYIMTNYAVKDDFFGARLCREVTHGVTLGSPAQNPGDMVTWFSTARRAWQMARVESYDTAGRLILLGVLAISGDSGAPVFTWGAGENAGLHYSAGGPAGMYVGVISEYVNVLNGVPVQGAKAVVYGNPRLDTPTPPIVTNPPPVVITPPPVTVVIPRLPMTMTEAGGFLFTIASPDSSMWRLEPATGAWTRVPAIPGIQKP